MTPTFLLSCWLAALATPVELYESDLPPCEATNDVKVSAHALICQLEVELWQQLLIEWHAPTYAAAEA